MASNNAQGPSRRVPASSKNADTASLRRRLTKDWAATVKETSEPPRTGLHAQYFSVYDIDWMKLKAWMEREFPEEAFKKELIKKVHRSPTHEALKI
jgi:hypothetical protein